jgi:hypothetical protein
MPCTVTSGWAQNSANAPYTTMMFHSIGTPSGTLLVMNVWSTSMSARPTISDAPPGDTSRISGTASSSAVPAWLIATASRDGRRSSGNRRYIRRRSQVSRSTGLLLTITHTTVGKWWLSLENPAQNHSASWTALAPAIQWPPTARHTIVVQ